MWRLGSNRKAISAGVGIFALTVGISLNACDRLQESADTPGSNGSVSSASSGSRGGGRFKRRTLASGLIIEDLVIGDGKECSNPIERVTIHYRGMLESGEEFDSSYARAQPIVGPLNGLIHGWQEGVPGMKVGGKRRLTVPADLAYSGMAAIQPGNSLARDSSGAVLIPPGATLIFEIELLDVKFVEQALQH